MIEAQVIGMTTQEAVDLIHDLGLFVRIRSEDGVENFLVQDYRQDRITLDIVNGKVTNAVRG